LGVREGGSRPAVPFRDWLSPVAGVKLSKIVYYLIDNILWSRLSWLRAAVKKKAAFGNGAVASLGVEHNGDFAFEFDGEGEVGSAVVVEVAGGDGEAALKVDGVVDGNCRAELAVALAIIEVRVPRIGGAGHVGTPVQIEVGYHAG
jgi:hypothetical protein